MTTKLYNKLVKKLDKQLATGKISRVEWRDTRWRLLQAARPVIHAKVTGLSQ